jgi:hypothetical protein
MAHTLDIFNADANGLIWQGTADNLEGAKANVKALRAKSPGDYVKPRTHTIPHHEAWRTWLLLGVSGPRESLRK